MQARLGLSPGFVGLLFLAVPPSFSCTTNNNTTINMAPADSDSGSGSSGDRMVTDAPVSSEGPPPESVPASSPDGGSKAGTFDASPDSRVWGAADLAGTLNTPDSGMGGGAVDVARGGGGTQPEAGVVDVSSLPAVVDAQPMQDLMGERGADPAPLSILSIGQPGNYGRSSASTDPFQTFINSKTNGTAKMEMVRTFKHIADLNLAKYDVLILQALEDDEYSGLWSYSQSDVDALNDWVTNKGGAVVAMSGYGGNLDEVQPLNQLLAPFGLSYNADDTFKSCPDNLCYCAYSMIAFSGWTANYADYDRLTHDLKKVGVFHGRSIRCTDSSCQIFAKDSAYGNVGVAKNVGSGHILAWSDDTVTYTTLWGLVPDKDLDSITAYPDCVGYTTNASYSVPQFWHNAFRWLAPRKALTFVLPDTALPLIP